MTRYRRRLRLILPRVQLRLIGAMAAVAAMALLLEYTLLVRSMLQLAETLPNDRQLLVAQASGSLGWVLSASIGMVLPVLILVALVVSHRFCGPIYRFHVYLRAVADGTERGECHLRKGDDLQELCDLINKTTAAARQSAPVEGASNRHAA